MNDFKKRIDFYITSENYEKLKLLQEYYSKETKIKFTITDTINRSLVEHFDEKCKN